MSYEKYCKLIDGVCERFKLADSKSAYDNFNLDLNGERIMLLHGGETDADGLYFFGDFGPLHDTEPAMVMEWLLANNLFSYGDSTQFAIDPVTGRVSLALRLGLSKINLESLLTLFSHVTIHMRGWRTSFYLHAVEQLRAMTHARALADDGFFPSANERSNDSDPKQDSYNQTAEMDANETGNNHSVKFLPVNRGALSVLVQTQIRSMLSQPGVLDLPPELKIVAAEMESEGIITRASARGT